MTFIKWMGGKSNILQELDKLLPPMNKINGYIENFLGGGSVFFHLKENYLEHRNVPIYLSDLNPELINTYRVVRDNPQELMTKLDILYEKHNEKFFNKVRINYFVLKTNNIEKAACMIYLNKTCFNGLWKVGKNGKLNFSIGHKEKVSLYDKNEIEKCSELLQGAKLNCISYEKTLQINKGDLKNWFTYKDCPYDGGYKDYNKDKFVHGRNILKRTFDSFNEKGCYVMLSNSKSPMMNTEFKKYYIHTIMAARINAANSASRGKIEEYVITNYEPEKKKTILDY